MSIAAAAKRRARNGHSKPVTNNKPQPHASRTAFPVAKVETLWKQGKTIVEIAKATGRYDDKAKDPTASFRGSVNQLRKKGLLKIGFRVKQK